MSRFFSFIEKLIIVFAYIAGVSILAMIGLTVIDVVLRIFNVGITGAYDMVRALGVIAVACALPYVTAVKGHIAIEYFYHKCNKVGRILLDTFFRVSSVVIFGILSFETFKYGLTLLKTGEVFATIGLPVFWIPFVISLNSFLMILVFAYHLIHPGKEYIKP
ncbi:MAG: TRAP transporter small permease [Spirochaetales bacterium]|nr:TRAP transporter small permease [Spirochaetales bacterium]